jgi:hypothetical protein
MTQLLTRVLLVLCITITACTTPETMAADDKAPAVKQVRIPHEIRKIDGWNVHVDTSLLKGEHKPTGDLVLKIAAQRLHRITMRIPAGPLAKMQEVPIYLDRNHPLGGAHFHPGAKWLVDHGYDPAMAKAIHLTTAGRLVRAAGKPGGGAVFLHELTHAYHNRVLGFNHKLILEGFKKFRASEKFDMVTHSSGRLRPHYGLMDQMEYFAEMTETFFAVNDFYPFVRTELMEVHPETYTIIAKIWGAKVQPPTKKRKANLNQQDLRILAQLKSERGDHDAALKLLDEAERKSPGNERVASLRKKLEAAKAKSLSK